jgi:hypothetical protein
MHALRTWALRIAIVGLATGGIVAACHNDVPGQTLPRPTREASPIGPRPQPIEPSPIRFESTGDAGIPLPTTATPGPAFIDDLRAPSGGAARSGKAVPFDDRGLRRAERLRADDEDAGIVPDHPDNPADPNDPGEPNEPGNDDDDGDNEDWLPEPMPDAGVSDVLVLPPVPDASPEVLPDAGRLPK